MLELISVMPLKYTIAGILMGPLFLILIWYIIRSVLINKAYRDFGELQAQNDVDVDVLATMVKITQNIYESKVRKVSNRLRSLNGKECHSRPVDKNKFG